MARKIASYFRRTVDALIAARMRQANAEVYGLMRNLDDETLRRYYGDDLQRIVR